MIDPFSSLCRELESARTCKDKATSALLYRTAGRRFEESSRSDCGVALGPLVAPLLEYVRAEADRAAAAAESTSEDSSVQDKVYQCESGADAFDLFIRTGSNVGMYEAIAEALDAAWPSGPFGALLDIGTGTGMALLPALDRRRAALQRARPPSSITLVEPSPRLMRVASAALQARGLDSLLDPMECTAQEFLQQCAESEDEPVWAVGQASFALQNICPAERQVVLRGLARRCERFFLVEFDVPAALAQRDHPVPAADAGKTEDGDVMWAQLLSPRRVEHILAAYVRGVEEYLELGDEGKQVVRGFLMPMLVASCAPAAAGVTHEQPMAYWQEELRACGFHTVSATRVFPYWWADAFVIEARGRTQGGARHKVAEERKVS